MAGTNGDDGMSSNVHNAGSRLLHGEGDLIDRELLIGDWSRRGEEKIFLSDYAGLQGTTGLPR